jgi:hypothetical protein
MKPEDLSHEEQDNIIKLALEILSERYQTGIMLTSPHAVRVLPVGVLDTLENNS